MSSIFDPKTFATMTFTGANDTKSVPIPVGDWPFEIAKSEITPWSRRGESTPAGFKLVLLMKTSAPEVVAITGRKENAVRYEVMLDLTPEGMLDMGKGMNVRLGKLREACRLNDPSRPFSFDQFVGHSVVGSITHRPTDAGDLVAECKMVAQME